MAKQPGKKELVAAQVAKLVKAGRPVKMETVEFSDPNRPKTCLEVDFPILPVNQVAIIEGNAGKPIYQMSKWWARRRSSVFRAMLLAAATKAPEDTSLAAPTIWDNYYGNHQSPGAFSHLKVADIFSGGGTTLVEGSRLGMQMYGTEQFQAEHSPKTLEAVANRARHGDDASAFYRRILTECWREAHRLLKPGGILALTFHHSEDDPWVNVLESLFEAGFYLEAIYPIRSDETKGEGEFGSKQVEFDMIHVCRKRLEDPTPVSWARMRKEVLGDIQQLRHMLESHSKAGLPAADLQVIRRGKALEYFSRHYGKVYLDEDTTMDVRRAVMGVNQLLEESAAPIQDPPPNACDPYTWQFLRIFADTSDVARDQLQKFLRGTSIAPQEFEARGWCREDSKVFSLVSPLEFAQSWHRRPRQKLAGDLDQALFLVGACWESSGMRADDTISSGNFTSHVALGPLLEWMSRRKGWPGVPGAAQTARTLLRKSEQARPKVQLGACVDGYRFRTTSTLLFLTMFSMLSRAPYEPTPGYPDLSLDVSRLEKVNASSASPNIGGEPGLRQRGIDLGNRDKVKLWQA